LNLPSEPHYARLAALRDGGVELGNAGLMLNVVTSLRRPSGCGGATVVDALRQRHRDLFGREIDRAALCKVAKFYTFSNEVVF
jgi:hypothetical protein